MSDSGTGFTAELPCESGPIHCPGEIQPHGAVLIVRPDGTIAQVSRSCLTWLGQPAEAWLDRSLHDIFPADQVMALLAAVDVIPRKPITVTSPLGIALDALILRHPQGLAIELEPVGPVVGPSIRAGVLGVLGPGDINTVCHEAVRAIRELTGFDRVGVCRFDDEGHGFVMAEARADDVDPLLGLHFPASDLPQVARALYTVNRFRLIPDACYEPSPLVPLLHPDTGEPTDLSMLSLRSVAAPHREYLQNMGVRASLSISILVKEKLWALIVAHHRQPSVLPWVVRDSCDLFGQVVSMRLERLIEAQESEERARLMSGLARRLEALANCGEQVVEGLTRPDPPLHVLTSASGAAVCLDEPIVTVGATPNPEQIESLVSWLSGHNDRPLFVTDRLAEHYPPAAAFADTGTGLIAAVISRLRRHYLLWFRGEIIRTIDWAGEPVRQPDAHGQMTRPRNSFAPWREVMSGRSQLWSQPQIEVAQELRAAVIDALLRRSEMRLARSSVMAHHAEELRLRDRALAAVTQGIIIADAQKPDRPIVFVNQGFERITGYTVAEALGRNCRFLQGPDTDPLMVARIRDALSNGQPVQVELINYRKNGEAFWNALSISPIHDAQGQVTHFIGLLTDVTDRVRLEEQFRHSQKLEAVGRLAGGVAHDFNNLLTVVIGCTELALLDQQLPPRLRELLESVEQAVRRGSGLTRQLLAFSRRQVLQPVVLDLNALIHDMRRMLGRLIGEHVRLQVQTAEQPLWVRADPVHLEQVILNLAVNARDAMPGGGDLTIQTRWAEQVSGGGTASDSPTPPTETGPFARLTVTDTGCGMDENVLEHIFEPFFTTKPAGSGTGLGLATVYGIVQQSGGYIRVESAPNCGTTFLIFLPLTEQPDPTAPVEMAPVVQPTAPVTGTGRILVVEDEDSVRALVVAILQRAGYEVVDASSGEEALAWCAHHHEPIDLLLTDVIMPGMSGAQLAERIASDGQIPRILFMSGYTDDAIPEEMLLDPGARLLSKPFTAETLTTKVRELLTL